MPHILRNPYRTAGEESSHPSLHHAPMSPDLPSGRIKTITILLPHRILLHIISQCQERRDGVRQIQQTARRNHAHEISVCWDGCRDQEGDAPPDWHYGGIEEFATPAGDERGVKQVAANVVVEDFDADVAVEPAGYEAGDER